MCALADAGLLQGYACNIGRMEKKMEMLSVTGLLPAVNVAVSRTLNMGRVGGLMDRMDLST